MVNIRMWGLVYWLGVGFVYLMETYSVFTEYF